MMPVMEMKSPKVAAAMISPDLESSLCACMYAMSSGESVISTERWKTKGLRNKERDKRLQQPSGCQLIVQLRRHEAGVIQARGVVQKG